MSQPYQYNPKKVVLIWNKIRIQGFLKGTFITAKPDEQRATKSVGNDGKATVILNPNKGASIEFSLQQGTTTNDILSLLVPDSDRNSLPVGECQLEDLNGTTLCHGENAWLQNFPEVVYGDGDEGRKWMLDVEAMDWFVGGSVL